MVFMYRRASFIATGSRQNIELIEREVSLAGKWEFVPFGVDLEKFTPRDGVSAPEHPFLLTVGSLKPRKGADYVIRALALIKDDVPDLHYYIVGSFDERNGFICQLQQLATENGLQERVHLLGRVSDEALRDMYQTCAVFVLAAQTVGGSFEGFPMVYYESQALGAPVIGTSGYGSDYIIHDGENGFLIPQENVTRLADAIRRIATDGVLRERMSVRARQEARRHSWSVIAKHYLVAYGRVTQS
jgi:glycosyltransferase involved in cell wall biosynthesis